MVLSIHSQLLSILTVTEYNQELPQSAGRILKELDPPKYVSGLESKKYCPVAISEILMVSGNVDQCKLKKKKKKLFFFKCF